MDMILNPALIDQLNETVAAHLLETIRNFMEAGADIVCFSGDYATKENLVAAPKHLERLCRQGKGPKGIWYLPPRPRVKITQVSGLWKVIWSNTIRPLISGSFISRIAISILSFDIRSIACLPEPAFKIL